MNFLISIWQNILIIFDGINAFIHLIYCGIYTLFSHGNIKENFSKLFAQASTRNLIFAILRAFKPNVSLSRIIIKSYENTGTIIVTKRQDVLDVLSRDADFEVVYGSRMREITNGDNFFLGMQPGADYQRNVSMMRLAARQSDISDIIVPRARTVAQEIIDQSEGKIDVPVQLTKKVAWDMMSTYFGTPGESPEIMEHWSTILFWYLFNDLDANADLDKESLDIAGKLRAYLDNVIHTRKNNPTDDDDLINRCLSLQTTNPDIITDINIRNNLLGLVVGAVPTISKACCLALDELLRRPEQLEQAMQAARNNNEGLMAQYIWEALRFNPHNPVIYRRATRDTIIARSSLRQQKVRKGQMVFAANFSAMFDRLDIPNPNQFLTNRTWETYIIWGYGLHKCFGAAINRAIIPVILKPLLSTTNLRRASGTDGQINMEKTPFPVHFHIEFDTK